MDFDVFWIFCLTPHLSDADYQKELDRLVMENGVDLDKFNFHKV